jgi:hypothetical protein
MHQLAKELDILRQYLGYSAEISAFRNQGQISGGCTQEEPKTGADPDRSRGPCLVSGHGSGPHRYRRLG